jgi:hypothetical protein
MEPEPKRPQRPTPGARAAMLAQATSNLTEQVSRLTDVVAENNKAISHMREELNQKPDDVEVKVIMGLAQIERFRQLRYLTGLLILSVLISVSISSLLL